MNIFADIYPEFVDRDNRKERTLAPISAEHLSNRFEAILPPEVVKGRTVLDLGSCLGAAGAWVLHQGAVQYVGVEVQPEYVKTSRELLARWPEASVEARDVAEFLENDARRFDIVVLGGILFAYVDFFRILRLVAHRANELISIDTAHLPLMPGKEGAWALYTDNQQINNEEGTTAFKGLSAKISPKALDICMAHLGWSPTTEDPIMPKRVHDIRVNDAYNDEFVRGWGSPHASRYLKNYVPGKRSEELAEKVAHGDRAGVVPMWSFDPQKNFRHVMIEIPTKRGVYRPRLRLHGSRTLAIFSPAQTVDAWRCHDLWCTDRTGSSIAQKYGMDVMLLDLLGYGESDPNPEASGGSYLRADVLEDLDEIMKWVREFYDTVVLVSFSLHTTAWAYWAAHNADIVAASVYLSPNQSSVPLNDALRAQYQRSIDQTKEFPRGRTATLESLKKRISSSQLGREGLLHPTFWEVFERQSRKLSSFKRDGTWYGISGLLQELCEERLRGEHIDAYDSHVWPTIIFRGEREPDTPLFMTEAVYDQIPSVRKKMVVIPGASHFYLWEKDQGVYLDELEMFFAALLL